MKTSAERQREFRHRQVLRIEQAARMETALRQIIAKLDGTEKPAALVILEIAKEGLG